MHNHGDSKQYGFNEDEGEQEAVTFLRQRRDPKGWDVVIERPPCSSMKESRFSLDAQDGRGWNQTNNFQATAIKPSAPPHEPWDPFWWSPTALGFASYYNAARLQPGYPALLSPRVQSQSTCSISRPISATGLASFGAQHADFGCSSAAVVGKPPKALQRKSGAMEKSTLPLDNGVNATFTSPVASQVSVIAPYAQSQYDLLIFYFFLKRKPAFYSKCVFSKFAAVTIIAKIRAI
ncbi:hypothetical protein HUJ04_009471 [Dendroctonus ponderosae]|nr:hypothetical protein HUJ04_009471 [Dendroctonus ponderosae]